MVTVQFSFKSNWAIGFPFKFDLPITTACLPLKFFSQGNLQRNKLLVAMNLNWDYLFIDEPFSNLDRYGIKIFKEIFTSLKSNGKSIIFSTHHIDESKSICDSMISIKNATFKSNVI